MRSRTPRLQTREVEHSEGGASGHPGSLAKRAGSGLKTSRRDPARYADPPDVGRRPPCCRDRSGWCSCAALHRYRPRNLDSGRQRRSEQACAAHNYRVVTPSPWNPAGTFASAATARVGVSMSRSAKTGQAVESIGGTLHANLERQCQDNSSRVATRRLLRFLSYRKGRVP